MALSKRKKPSILRKMVAESVTESDSVSEKLIRGIRTQDAIPSEVVTSTKTHKDVPNDIRTACDEAANVITRIATFDRKAKSILHDVYEEIDDILKSEHFFPEIKDEMTAEFGDLTKVIHLNQTDVYEELCPIVITGETSAGKSTFVNLMLGVELLPQSPLTCTSPICRISNRDHKTIVLTDSVDNQEIIKFSKNDDAEELRRLLKDYICVSKAGEKYKAVDICWPIPCLQNKIMIVDTPGISPENDLLAHRLFEYLPSALVFIYVINPTNAGGIQSDSLQRILDEQDRRQLMGTRSVFDPRRAIFVCNKWDQIHEDEEVFSHIRQKLQEKWTNFDSSKIYRISAREEMQRSKNGEPISRNFMSLLQGIDKMIPACLEDKIFRHANWQRYFLVRLDFKLLTNAPRTQDEKRIMAYNVLERIAKVRGNLSTVQKRLIDVAKEQCRHISEKLNAHLHLPETCERMFTWLHEELPENDSMAAIENEIAAFVENKVKEEVKFWLLKTNNGGLSEFMTEKIQRECYIFETDCTDIDEMILGQSLDDCSLGMSLRREIKGTLDFSNISTGKKAAIIASFPLWAPYLVVFGLNALPFRLGSFFTKKMKNRKDVTDYRQRKTDYVKEVAYKMMENVTIQTISDKVLRYFFKDIEDEIKEFCTSTMPSRIRAGELLLKRILVDISEQIKVRRQCLLLHQDIKSAYGRVLFIYMEYFDMQKLKQSHMRKRDTPNSAEVFVNGKWIDTVVKERKWSYENNTDCSMLFDITMLRNHQHKNILNFIGVTILPRKKGKLLQLHLEKCDNNLEIVIFHRSTEEEPWKNVKAYLCQSLEGLAFLHLQGLIHRNIKSSNILIKDGIAKLSDIGIGSKRQFSEKSSSTDPQSLLYEQESDVFRFGILLWESWYRRSALNCDSHSPFESYEELSNIIRDGWQPDFDGKIPSKIKTLITTCWQKDPADRLSAKQIFDILQKENE